MATSTTGAITPTIPSKRTPERSIAISRGSTRPMAGGGPWIGWPATPVEEEAGRTCLSAQTGPDLVGERRLDAGVERHLHDLAAQARRTGEGLRVGLVPHDLHDHHGRPPLEDHAQTRGHRL